ncbi:MAG TPA: ParA family protein [Gemmatimonadaceae bacterium]|nr:ParA family protein [Gemmatimonadaceae bacterium]
MRGTLAVVSQKGGVGKTTTAINLAAALAKRGVRTLLIDIDPQGSVRFGLGLRSEGGGIAEYLEGTKQLPEIVRATALPFLRVLLAGSVVDTGDHAAYQQLVATSPRLRELFELAVDRGYTVIVDTPPGLGPIVRAVMAASDRVVVPLQCEPLALQTTSQILKGIRDVIARHDSLRLEGIVLTLYEDDSEICRKIAARVREQLPPELVFEAAVPRTRATVEAFAAGQPVVLRSPEDPAAVAYAALAEALETRLG